MNHTLPYQWIVFDAVGTLIHPTPSVAEAYWSIGREFGSRLDLAGVSARFSQHFQESFSHGDSSKHRSSEQIELARWRRIVDRVLDDVDDGNECFQKVHAHFSRPDAWSVFDDVADALNALAEEGYRIAIGSNFDERLHDVIAGLPELCCVEKAFASAELGYRKPAVGFYRELGDRLESSPQDMLMIGDHFENDVRGARTAGLSALLIDRSDAMQDETDSLNTLSRLLDILAAQRL